MPSVASDSGFWLRFCGGKGGKSRNQSANKLKACATVSAVMLVIGMASGQRVKWSLQVSR